MELLIFVIAICAVAFAATRFGYDSRAVAWSKEAELAAHGVTWEPHGLLALHVASSAAGDMRDSDSSEPPLQEFGERPRELVGSVRGD